MIRSSVPRQNFLTTSGVPKKNGGTPEGARQGNQHMLNVAEKALPSKARIVSDVAGFKSISDERRAVQWLDEQLLKSQHEVRAVVAELTPAIANVLLVRNQNNRKVSAVAVAKYARDINNGAWSLNGQTVVVSRDGDLNDGQHRCLGVIEANRAVPVVFVFGTERDSRFTLDQGKNRMAGDYLGMLGHVDSLGLAAVASSIWQHREIGRISTQTAHRPTKGEVLAVVEQHPDIAESLAFIPRKGCDSVGGRSMLAFAHWTFAKRATVPAANDFIVALVDGHNLTANDPILYARNRIMALRGRLRPNEKAELIFRAWNSHRKRETPKTLPILNGALPVVER